MISKALHTSHPFISCIKHESLKSISSTPSQFIVLSSFELLAIRNITMSVMHSPVVLILRASNTWWACGTAVQLLVKWFSLYSWRLHQCDCTSCVIPSCANLLTGPLLILIIKLKPEIFVLHPRFRFGQVCFGRTVVRQGLSRIHQVRLDQAHSLIFCSSKVDFQRF